MLQLTRENLARRHHRRQPSCLVAVFCRPPGCPPSTADSPPPRCRGVQVGLADRFRRPTVAAIACHVRFKYTFLQVNLSKGYVEIPGTLQINLGSGAYGAAWGTGSIPLGLEPLRLRVALAPRMRWGPSHWPRPAAPAPRTAGRRTLLSIFVEDFHCRAVSPCFHAGDVLGDVRGQRNQLSVRRQDRLTCRVGVPTRRTGSRQGR